MERFALVLRRSALEDTGVRHLSEIERSLTEPRQRRSTPPEFRPPE